MPPQHSSSSTVTIQQYYKTFHSSHRDVLLLELEEAQRAASAQTKLYGQIANAVVAVAALVVALVFGDRFDHVRSAAVTSGEAIGFLVALMAIVILVLLYFAELQKTATLNARKVITLRGALGLDYARLHLTLPPHRVEGATDPFAVRIFPGWTSAVTYPLWTLGILFVVASYVASGEQRGWDLGESLVVGWIHVSIAGTLVAAFFFRHRLQEEHENLTLRCCYVLSRIMGIRLLPNFSYILFRARLAVNELRRLGFETDTLEQMLVAIEDRDFHRHGGISWRGLVRGMLSRAPVLRRRYGWARSGGSTITMQLGRTLLVEEYWKGGRRKICELLLARWLERTFDKDELLLLYIGSVRFDYRAFGLADAMRRFFGSSKKRNLSAAEAFFLVERLSARPGTYRLGKVRAQLRRAAEAGFELTEEEVLELYGRLPVDSPLELAVAPS